MSAGTIVAIVVVVIVVAALIAVGSLAARRRRLQQRFGPEYDRAVEGSDSRLKAEAELAEREKRVKGLDLRPIEPAARASYLAQWTSIQEQFVDSPTDAVTAAQSLITGVMADRGYPIENVDQITADLSVDHASTLGRFRTAQDISARVADGTASTEDLRQAMVHYHALFADLLGEPANQGSRSAVATESTSQQFTASDPEEIAK
jgi:Tfp pilus assembly protein PilX